jgi:transposase
MADWLPKTHFVYFVINLVEQLDTSAFLGAYRADGKGGTAYHPVMMLTLLAYAYCDGERSSRRIEEHCRTDAAYRIITGGLFPDHSTVARFRERHEKDIAALFVHVLGICLGAGLGAVDFAAADGTKLRCPASLRANRKLDSIEKEITKITGEIEAELARLVAEILAEARRCDLEDDPLDGTPPAPPREPGTLPDVVGLPRKLHGKAARLARLERAKKVLDDDYAAECADHEAKMAERTAKEAATGKKTPGRKPKPPERDPDKKANVTDPDSRIMKDAHGGYLQGYNAQNVAAADQLSIAADVVADCNDAHQLHPCIERAAANLAAAGAEKKMGTFATDSGYCTDEALAAIKPDGPDVLTATGKEHKARKRAAEEPVNEGPPPEGLTPRKKMEWKLGTAEGKAAYPRRAATVEPGFAQHKHNRGFLRFLRVGLSAADSEWKLMNATANIKKLYRKMLAGEAAPDWCRLAEIVADPGAV